MKTSNVILAAWVLIVAGLALMTVWYLKASDSSGPAQTDPGNVILKPTPPGTGGKPAVEPGKRGTRVNPPVERPPAAPLEISGRVVDVENKPVAGAVVRLLTPSKPGASAPPADTTEIRRVMQVVPITDEDAPRVRSLASWWETPPGSAARVAGSEIATTSSGADGKFTFSVPESSGTGPYHLAARADAVGSANAVDVYTGNPVDLMLTSGGVVTGSVTGETDGAAIAGARVVFDSGEREYAAMTDAKGQFRIDGMPPGRFSVRAGAKGRTPILDRPIQVLRGESVALKLPRGTTLRVKTVNLPDEETAEENGPPVPNAEVVAIEESAQIYVIGKSNDYGIVEFPGMPAGSWMVNGRAVDFVSTGEMTFDIGENEEVHEEFVSFEKAVLTPIEVVDANGSAIPGVEFFTCDPFDAYDSVRSEKVPGATDRDGKFSFPFEFSGPRCKVFGFKKGFGLVEAYPVEYQAGDPIKLVMKKAVRVHGKVVDEKGAPVPDATVRLTFDPKVDDSKPVDPDKEEGEESRVVTLHTDVKGRYAFDFCPEGFDITLDAETEDSWADDMPTVEQVDGKTEYEVDLRLERSEETGALPLGAQEFRGTPRSPPPPVETQKK